MDPAQTDPYDPPSPINDTAIALGQAYAAGRRQGRSEA